MPYVQFHFPKCSTWSTYTYPNGKTISRGDLYIQLVGFERAMPVPNCMGRILMPKAITIFTELHLPLGLIGCDTSESHGLVFEEGTPDKNIETVTAAAKAFDWTDTADLDLSNFQNAIFTDGTVATLSKIQLSTMMAVIAANASKPSAIQKCWSDLKDASLSWLDSGTISAVEHYALQYSVPLVPIVSTTNPAGSSSDKSPSSTTFKSPSKPQQKK
jgi:hypothetical protein